MCRGLPVEGLGVAPSANKAKTIGQQTGSSARPPQYDDIFLQYTYKVSCEAGSFIFPVYVITAHTQQRVHSLSEGVAHTITVGVLCVKYLICLSQLCARVCDRLR